MWNQHTTVLLEKLVIALEERNNILENIDDNLEEHNNILKNINYNLKEIDISLGYIK